jgi:hypothetical protein
MLTGAWFFLIAGSGERTAESYDGEVAAAPLLHIEYSSASTPTPTPTPTGPTPTALPGSDSAHFAVIGDFGVDNTNEADVATLVDDWTPGFIVTVGDNVYGTNLADITPDDSSPYCNGGNSSVNRFFPAFGNHDYSDGPIYGSADYLGHFDLQGNGLPSSNTSGNELYYDVVQGPIHLFIINSDSISRAGGAGSDEYNEQRDWLQAQLAASTSAWQIVLFHHAAYSSSSGHGSQTWMQWPFANWGADAVLSGHDHTYERINLDGIVYFVNGLGGRSPYGFDSPIPGSQVRYNDNHGAMLVDADENGITFQFITPSATPPPAGNAIVQALNHLSSTGNSVVVAIDALNLSAPGLAAATIEVFYDETVLTLLSCEPDPDNLLDSEQCNPSAGSNHLSFSLLSSDGVTGEFTLANLVFEVKPSAKMARVAR